MGIGAPPRFCNNKCRRHYDERNAAKEIAADKAYDEYTRKYLC